MAKCANCSSENTTLVQLDEKETFKKADIYVCRDCGKRTAVPHPRRKMEP